MTTMKTEMMWVVKKCNCFCHEIPEDYNVTLLDPVDYIEKNDLYIRFVKVTK